MGQRRPIGWFMFQQPARAMASRARSIAVGRESEHRSGSKSAISCLVIWLMPHLGIEEMGVPFDGRKMSKVSAPDIPCEGRSGKSHLSYITPESMAGNARRLYIAWSDSLAIGFVRSEGRYASPILSGSGTGQSRGSGTSICRGWGGSRLMRRSLPESHICVKRPLLQDDCRRAYHL